MRSLPGYTALLVTFNNECEIPSLLNDLERLHPPPQTTLIVDNASSDRTVGTLRERFPAVKILPNSSNLGLGKAINLGFTRVVDEFVLLLNPDLCIPDPEFAKILLSCLLDDPQAAAVGPLQFKRLKRSSYPNFTWSFCSPRTFPLYLASLFKVWPASLSNPIPVTYLNFGCLLLRRSAFESTGGLNESYFLYGEEPDLFLKLKRLHYKALLHPGAQAIHYRERSLIFFPPARRLWLKIRGSLNILHALMFGYKNILQDKWSLG